MDMSTAEWRVQINPGYELLVVNGKNCARVNLDPENEAPVTGKYEMRCLEGDKQARAETGRGVSYYYCDSVSEAKELAETLVALLPSDRA